VKRDTLAARFAVSFCTDAVAGEFRGMTWKRVATAVVLIPFVVGLVLYASTAVVAVALAAVIALAMIEYFALGDAIGHRAYRVWTLICAGLLIYTQWSTVSRLNSVVIYFNVTPLRAHIEHASGGLNNDVFLLFLLGISILTLATNRPMVEALPAAGISSSALLLVAFPLSFAVRLHGMGALGPKLLLFALVITWAGDTVAYFVGRAIGKHPFAPILSPKKTWEGAVGGFVGSLLVGVAFSKWTGIAMGQMLAMAAVGNVAGQVGDLLESAYKRSAGVKDSGTLLPGHGGILDRIDALILAIPVVCYYWILFAN
jgi:phosphatidate cytidylyltransferase